MWKNNTSVLFPLCSNCHLFCIIPVVNVIRSSDAAQQARFITFLLFIDFYIYSIKYMSTILHPLDSR